MTGADSAIAQLEIYDPADSANTYKVLTYIWTCSVVSTGYELNPPGNISLHPNPFTDKLNIELPSEGNYDLVLYDITFRIAIEIKIERSVSLDVGFLPEGLYIYRILNNSEVLQTGKITRH